MAPHDDPPPPNFNRHNIGSDGLNIIAKTLIPTGTSVLAGMCSAALFRPPHTHIPLEAFSRNGASCLPDVTLFHNFCASAVVEQVK